MSSRPVETAYHYVFVGSAAGASSKRHRETEQTAYFVFAKSYIRNAFPVHHEPGSLVFNMQCVNNKEFIFFSSSSK